MVIPCVKMTKKGVLHPDQNDFVEEKERRKGKIWKERKRGGKEVRHLLISSVRTGRGSTSQEVS